MRLEHYKKRKKHWCTLKDRSIILIALYSSISANAIVTVQSSQRTGNSTRARRNTMLGFFMYIQLYFTPTTENNVTRQGYWHYDKKFLKEAGFFSWTHRYTEILLSYTITQIVLKVKCAFFLVLPEGKERLMSITYIKGKRKSNEPYLTHLAIWLRSMFPQATTSLISIKLIKNAQKYNMPRLL